MKILTLEIWHSRNEELELFVSEDANEISWNYFIESF
jgi:hypothetical protein